MFKITLLSPKYYVKISHGGNYNIQNDIAVDVSSYAVFSAISPN